uniref:Uncharacterized protein n=1 Tax=Myotis myotis TaxID=51298 RepID=A0A7J7XHU9_MYOMY|nr:hypothetical protein mMyoMyo1_011813 [Myotis myotis]
MPPSVTLKVGPIGGLGHRPVTLKARLMGRLRRHPLSRTEQGQSGRGLGRCPLHTQSRAHQGVGALPLSHSGQGRWGGYGSTPSHTEQGPWGGGGGWGAPPYQAQSRAAQGVGATPPVSHTEPQGDQGVWALPRHADPGAGRHITLLLYRVETWCMGGGRLVCPEGCPGSGWGSPLGCLASLSEGMMAVCSWSHTLQGGGPHWGAWPVWVRG